MDAILSSAEFAARDDAPDRAAGHDGGSLDFGDRPNQLTDHRSGGLPPSHPNFRKSATALDQ